MGITGVQNEGWRHGKVSGPARILYGSPQLRRHHKNTAFCLVYLFVRDLFSDAVTTSEYTVSDHILVKW